ncbi:MAG: DUF1553 domain-containing protein [Planctomycetes bacterium]|nr:DUF1553 domain-containing protein [Planctomycetota bacterium]
MAGAECSSRNWVDAFRCSTWPRTLRWFTLIGSWFLYSSLPSFVSAEESVDYLQQIKPILRDRCFACHGALKQESGFRLDTAELAVQGGDSGKAIEPFDMNGSRLIERVTSTEEGVRMPPEGEPLTGAQVALLRNWIAAGAKGPDDEQPEADPAKHWAFQPIVRPSLPEAKSDRGLSPIDALLQHRQEKHGIKPQPEAPRIVLLRRLYLDLLGIPPTLDEIAAVEADTSPDWYEQTVKRLLDDPRHGERWARHWMDIWRYSDWWGLGDQLRNSQKHIWHWRDWIVESLNADLPYDEMVRLMLAADESHPSDLGRLRATGYLARNYWLFNRPQWMEETVEHVSKGFLGLTMNCSRCHDHKYDPIGQTDYYRLRAFFEPYHVRLDMVPGEVDLTRDGIPRAFDGLLEEPTYLYVRGDERNPDKSKIMTPGVPAILAFDEIKIEPVSLPSDAWQPERRAGILDAHVAASKKRVEAAESDLKKSQEKLISAIDVLEKFRKEKEEASQSVDQVVNTVPEKSPKFSDSFQTLDTTRWKLFGGEWVHEPNGLAQKKDGPTRSALRIIGNVPRDFDATLRFTILGGSQWRSVGLAFDASQEDPTQPFAASDSEQMVYASAYAAGSKIQASFHRGGEWQYPGGSAVRGTPIQLNQEYTLRLQVRESLINASLNGELQIAWESTLARRDGALQVITFDALAVLHEVSIDSLDPAVALRQPDASNGNAPLSMGTAELAVRQARAEQTIAEATLAVVQAEVQAVERRAEAQRSEWDPQDTMRQEKIAAAIRAERFVAVAKSRQSVAKAELALINSKSDTKEASEKSLKDARESLEKAIVASETEVAASDQYVKFSGAMWTPTRFLDSGKDDPEVKFHAQSTGRRTALASWITDRRNPLTARVAVNHIWARHMGQPLVPTVFDFGRKGIPPSQPELLDWLASELIESGWSMKHLHSLIVRSAAYRMSSSVAGGDAAFAKDPENKLWWRRVPIRIESQVVRDSLLSLAGTLDPTMGGPSVPLAEQSASQRRSLYFFHSNNERNLFLTTFDEALVKDCYRREQSIVPQQALALSNSNLTLEIAEKIAGRLSENNADEIAFIRAAFRLVIGVNSNQDEMAVSMVALASWRGIPGESEKSARSNLVWALINHNDFVTLR